MRCLDCGGIDSVRRVISMSASLVLSAAVIAPHACLAEDAAERGAFVFDGNCADCHKTTADGKGKGPTLFGIVGRTAGQVADFDYSDANKNSKLVFDRVTLDNYVASPNELIPGTKMRFPGLPIVQDRKDLIEFLATLK